MTKTIENLFVYSAIYSSVIFFFLLLIDPRRAWNSNIFRAVSLYLGYEFLTDQIALFYNEEKIIYLVYSLFTILETIAFSFIFYQILKNERVKKVIPVIAVAFLIFELIYYLTAKRKIIDTIPIGIETLIFICYSCIFLFEQVEDLATTTFIYDRYSFWLVSGILIYLAGSCFIYMSANLVDSVTRSNYWTFTNGFLILKKILLSISLLVYFKQSKKQVRRVGIRFN